MFGAGLDVHCRRSWCGKACSWHLVDGQYMGSSWEPRAIAVTLCDAPHRPAIDLKIETEIPSEVRDSIHDDAARREVVIRPEVPRWGTSLRNSADENCAPKNQHQKNIPREAVF
jgi:hypothetical protein